MVLCLTNVTELPRIFITKRFSSLKEYSCIFKRGESTISSTLSPRTIFSGIQPTGPPHLGNYLGAIRQWVNMQRKEPPSSTILICIADYHAITQPKNFRYFGQFKQQMYACLIASGIDPERCILYEQSDVKEHTELAWILSCITPIGQLNRMTQWKNKAKTLSGCDTDPCKLKLGLYAYPVLQAADILLYRTTHVPVGYDQLQHIELARRIGRTFNHEFDSNVFVEPQVISTSNSQIMSLKEPAKKMSKSHPQPQSRILLTDSPDLISVKIGGAVTDSIQGITWDPENRPGVANLLSIMNALLNTKGTMVTDETAIEQTKLLAKEVANCNHSEFKKQVAQVIIESLRHIQNEYFRLIEDRAALKILSEKNVKRARALAQSTMAKVKESIGFPS